MNTGHYISGAGHLALIGWALFGGLFRPEPMPFEMTEVSVVSGAEYEALVAAERSPQSATEVAQPDVPDVAAETPQVAAAPDTAIDQPEPVQTETPPADAPPEAIQEAPPPDADVSDQAPESPEPPSDVAVMVPEVAPDPVPRPAPRVAPEPVARPDPEVKPDPVEEPAVSPDAAAETTAEPTKPTAPEEATTEIVTEATETPKAAPNASPRPPARPIRTAVAEPAEEPADEPAETPAPATDKSAVDAALAEAIGNADETEAAPEPSGPPLSSGEKEALRVAVSNCWNVGSLSSEALKTTVIVTVSMNQDGTPQAGSIRLAGSSGGSDAASKQAFEAARRAIIRCGAKGYQLPAEKFGQWQEIEMTFNPERMRIK